MRIETLLSSDPAVFGFPPLVLLKEYYLYARLSKRTTRMMGTMFKPTKNRIAIDLTYDCNLRCPGCCRSCSQAPAKEYLSTQQVQKFIEESIKTNRKWEIIKLMGGEPTLHPEFLEICDMIHSYKTNHSTKTTLLIETNGHGERFRDLFP